jgi:glutamine synthetase type III
MERVRSLADELERIIPEHHWQLPSYQQMLWLK